MSHHGVKAFLASDFANTFGRRAVAMAAISFLITKFIFYQEKECSGLWRGSLLTSMISSKLSLIVLSSKEKITLKNHYHTTLC